ncbi:sugar phosphate nucleotidyltransferase [Candidatus Chloroploca mongolica]|nr:sugar phosphate nucleotidyltransferase [Candidatus Chloroploca mongolica]
MAHHDTMTHACTTRHAVILAAGESKRTRPLTLLRPKPLIPLLGRPLLTHILDELVGLVDRVTLVVGYRADQIEATFGADYQGIALRYVRQEVVNGTAGALLAAQPVDEPFFLLYGDNLVAQADLLGVCQSRYGVAGLRVADARSFGVLQIVDGKVYGMLEKPADPPPDALANPGIYQFDQVVFPLVETITPSPRGELELTDLIALLAARHPVRPHICTGFWVPVGNPWEALSSAQFLVMRQAHLRASIDPSATLHPEAQLEGAVHIGKAVIEAGARLIGPVAIGDGCIIKAGATVQASALASGVVVGEGATIQASWLDEHVVIGDKATLTATIFEEVQPTVETRGLLTVTQLKTRGAILASGVTVPPGAQIAPGTILAQARSA